MLMNAEQAKTIYNNFHDEKIKKQLDYYCSQIEANFRCGRGTLIDNSELLSYEIIRYIEGMGYLVIYNPYMNEYLVTVNQQHVDALNKKIEYCKTVDRLIGLGKISIIVFALLCGYWLNNNFKGGFILCIGPAGLAFMAYNETVEVTIREKRWYRDYWRI